MAFHVADSVWFTRFVSVRLPLLCDGIKSDLIESTRSESAGLSVRLEYGLTRPGPTDIIQAIALSGTGFARGFNLIESLAAHVQGSAFLDVYAPRAVKKDKSFGQPV